MFNREVFVWRLVIPGIGTVSLTVLVVVLNQFLLLLVFPLECSKYDIAVSLMVTLTTKTA